MRKNFCRTCFLQLLFCCWPGRSPSGRHTQAYPARVRPAWPRVTVDGCGEDVLLSLAEDGCYSVKGGWLPVTLEISGGRIRFVESQCPDHICEHYGWLSQEYDLAVCMPAGVAVTVELQ